MKRIVALGGMGVLNSTDEKMLMDEKDYPKEFLPVGMEHRKAYEHLLASGLDWTFVCSPDIVNDGPTGSYSTRKDYPPPNANHINAGDLAQFMLNELERNEFVESRVGISAI